MTASITFKAKLAKLAKSADVAALADALGALVTVTPRRVIPQAAPYVPAPRPAKRAPRRTGRWQAYTPTGLPVLSRRGTFRTFMLQTILAHRDTASARRAHLLSGEYPTHKLDFRWAADNGYITLI